MTAPLLRIDGLVKRFGALVALDGVSLDVAAGEVHALLGENGAGKSTLLHVLYGLARPDAGRLLWNGEPIRLETPSDAIRLGIGMVHQHFMLVPAFTVWENVLLTHPDRERFLTRRDAARSWVRAISERHGLALDPDARVASLPVGARGRVEIAKALARDASLLILDEPTAVLTPGETRDFLALVKSLRAGGAAVLFVSHKISEVVDVADRVTVLRRGSVVGRFEGALDPRTLARCVLGEEGTAAIPVRAASFKSPGADGAGAPRLELRGLGARFPGGVSVDGVTFEVHAGEIVGVAGVDGNGQEELAALLAGIVRASQGRLLLDGEDVTGLDLRERSLRGLAILPGDRGREGLVLDFSVWENLALRTFGTGPARAAYGLLARPSAHRAHAARLLEDYDIRGPGILAPAGSLSGGNQQKLLLAREMERRPRALVALHPTRGLDVGAAAEVAARLRSLRDDGAAILLVSTELDELLEVADRVGVLSGGRWREIPSRDRDAIGAAMLAGSG